MQRKKEVRYFRKPRYISKKKPSLKAQLTRRIGMNGTFATRLSTFLSINATAAGTTKSSNGIVAGLKVCSDWNSYAVLYSYYTIKKIKMKVFIAPTSTDPTTQGILPMGVVVYDSSSDATVLLGINSALARNNYMVFSGDKTNQQNSNTMQGLKFKFTPIAQQQPPILCSAADEVFGYIKTVTTADWVDATTSKLAIYIILDFYVIFSGNI